MASARCRDDAGARSCLHRSPLGAGGRCCLCRTLLLVHPVCACLPNVGARQRARVQSENVIDPAPPAGPRLPRPTPRPRALLARQTLAQYLATRPPRTVLSVTAADPLGLVLRRFACAGLVAAPLFADDARSRYCGFLDLLDVVAAVVGAARQPATPAGSAHGSALRHRAAAVAREMAALPVGSIAKKTNDAQVGPSGSCAARWVSAVAAVGCLQQQLLGLTLSSPCAAAVLSPCSSSSPLSWTAACWRRAGRAGRAGQGCAL